MEEHLEDKQKQIAGEILKEIRTRLKFMLDVGLEYLSLNRQSMTLSGGVSAYSFGDSDRFTVGKRALYIG